ncbi:MAG: CarD family transcriptional regulator [Methylocella sp.]
MAAIKKSEQEISTGSALGPTGAIVPRVLAKRAAPGGRSHAAGKGSDKPFAAKITAKALDSQTPPSIESRPGARASARLDAAQTNMVEAKPGEKSFPPAHKPAKAATPQRQLFKPHEYVVYPAHGVGQIVAIEEQEVAGFKLELFVVRFVRDKMILKVPTPKAASVGMRRLADAPAIKAALDTLTGRARVKRTMWSRRAQEYEAKINSGDLKAIAEVVRDLYRSDTQPEQSYSERQLYETALDRMAREILVVQKLTETESLKVIETQLQKGPRRGKTEESEAEEADIEQAA